MRNAPIPIARVQDVADFILAIVDSAGHQSAATDEALCRSFYDGELQISDATGSEGLTRSADEISGIRLRVWSPCQESCHFGVAGILVDGVKIRLFERSQQQRRRLDQMHIQQAAPPVSPPNGHGLQLRRGR